jgi:crotonobetaine/carnitine-CoA ligase
MLFSNRTRWTVRDVALAQLASRRDTPFASATRGPVETYGTFIETSAKLANRLAELEVVRGAPVAIVCGTGLQHLHAWLACKLIGAIEVPINTALRGQALEHILATAQPAVAVVEAELLPPFLEAEAPVDSIRNLIVVGAEGDLPLGTGSDLRFHSYDNIVTAGSSAIPDATMAPSDIGSIMFTSGTTGPAKGAMMPDGQLCLLALQSIEAMHIGEADVFYCAHPLNHIAGKYMGVFATFAAGGRVVLDARFDASRWLDRVRETGVTVSIAHGPMIEMIAARPPHPNDREHDLHRLMCCPMPKHLWSSFEERFGLKGVEMWGMTEIACPVWTSLDGPRVEGSCGRPLTQWYDLQVVDPDTDEELPPMAVGEIVVRPRYPSTMMQGYLGMPEETVKAWRNLWFHSGDAAYFDPDGNLFFVDRLKDRIRRRSENISAYDIEVAALAFPSVREAAAVGVPSGFEGDDDIKLCIVLENDATFDPDSLIRFMAGRLAPFMVPRYVEVLTALPRTPTNKVRKRDLSSQGITTTTWDRALSGLKLRDLYEGASKAEKQAGEGI